MDQASVKPREPVREVNVMNHGTVCVNIGR